MGNKIQKIENQLKKESFSKNENKPGCNVVQLKKADFNLFLDLYECLCV